MILEILNAFILIFIAEMGDKTQILAMTFATKYPVRKVLLGIFVGVVLNHGLAVALGSNLNRFIPINIIQIIAGIAFIGFSIWTILDSGEEDDEESSASKFGPIITIALAFFIGELGDKTQLTAITLSADSKYPVLILCGTVLGMIATGGMGIFVGKKIGDKIPEIKIKIVASFVFLVFGVLKLYSNISKEYLTIINLSVFCIVMVIVYLVLIRRFINIKKSGVETTFIKKSRELYEYYNDINKKVNNICLGENKCINCVGGKCIIGNTKIIINNEISEKKVELENDVNIFNKEFDKDKVIESLRTTIEIINLNENKNLDSLNSIRKNLETILFNGYIEKFDNLEQYKKELFHLNKEISLKIFK